MTAIAQIDSARRKRRANSLAVTALASWSVAGLFMLKTTFPLAGLIVPAFPVFTIPELFSNRWYRELVITVVLTFSTSLMPLAALLWKGNFQRTLAVLAHVSIVLYILWNSLIFAVVLAGPK